MLPYHVVTDGTVCRTTVSMWIFTLGTTGPPYKHCTFSGSPTGCTERTVSRSIILTGCWPPTLSSLRYISILGRPLGPFLHSTIHILLELREDRGNWGGREWRGIEVQSTHKECQGTFSHLSITVPTPELSLYSVLLCRWGSGEVLSSLSVPPRLSFSTLSTAFPSPRLARSIRTSVKRLLFIPHVTLYTCG